MAISIRASGCSVTGHTGFKGSWLTTWLVNLGANVIGVSKNVPTQPSLFEELGLGNRIKDIREDVRNLDAMATLIQNERPDFVFHLAAQSIVSVSYTDPVETLTTNVMGTPSRLRRSENRQAPLRGDPHHQRQVL